MLVSRSFSWKFALHLKAICPPTGMLWHPQGSRTGYIPAPCNQGRAVLVPQERQGHTLPSCVRPWGPLAWLCPGLGFTCDHLLTPSVRCSGNMGFPAPFLSRALTPHARKASISSQDWFAPSTEPEGTAALKRQWQYISHVQRNVQKRAGRDESILINTQDHLKSERRREALSLSIEAIRTELEYR